MANTFHETHSASRNAMGLRIALTMGVLLLAALVGYNLFLVRAHLDSVTVGLALADSIIMLVLSPGQPEHCSRDETTRCLVWYCLWTHPGGSVCRNDHIQRFSCFQCCLESNPHTDQCWQYVGTRSARRAAERMEDQLAQRM